MSTPVPTQRHCMSFCAQCHATARPLPAAGNAIANEHSVVAATVTLNGDAAPNSVAAVAPAVTLLHPTVVVHRFLRCRRCYSAAYCNAACQRAHWPAHKSQCRDPSLKPTPRSAALFVGTGGAKQSILEIMFAHGWGRDIHECLGMCWATRVNPKLWPLVNIANGPKQHTRLMYWSAKGDLSQVKVCFTFPCCDANVPDVDGNTALHYAAVSGCSPVVRELLTHGARPNARGGKGRTPMHEAAWNNHVQVVRDLALSGADVNARDESTWTPLIIAGIQNHADIVIALLESGADLNVQDKQGWSALMAAACLGNLEVVRILLAAPGVALDLTTIDGVTTALRAASKEGYAAVVAALIVAGAR